MMATAQACSEPGRFVRRVSPRGVPTQTPGPSSRKTPEPAKARISRCSDGACVFVAAANCSVVLRSPPIASAMPSSAAVDTQRASHWPAMICINCSVGLAIVSDMTDRSFRETFCVYGTRRGDNGVAAASGNSFARISGESELLPRHARLGCAHVHAVLLEQLHE